MKDKFPLVSVLMPAYNAEKYIRTAIDSVLNQSYPAIELIVVNDGSKDNTASILEQYADKVTVIHQGNAGQCAANNRAFAASKGEYVKFFDADDLMSPDHIALQVVRLTEQPNCVVAGECWRFYHDDPGNARFEPLATWQDLKPLDWLIIDQGKGLGMMQCGLFLIPRVMIEQAGGWNEDLSLINDFEFFPRILMQAEQVLYAQGARLYYRSGMLSSLSAQSSEKHLRSAYKALSATTELLLAKGNVQNTRRVLAFYWRLWSYEFYPNQVPLYRLAIQIINELGGYPHISKGGISGVLSKILGWKVVKRLKILVNKISVR